MCCYSVGVNLHLITMFYLYTMEILVHTDVEMRMFPVLAEFYFDQALPISMVELDINICMPPSVNC